MKKYIVCIVVVIAISMFTPIQVFAAENINNIVDFLQNIF